MSSGRYGVALVVGWGILAGTACAKSAPAAGLEVIIATNLKDPSEYDGLTVDVSQGTDAGGFRSVYAKSYAGGQLKLPGTFAISPGKSPDETALIVVTATKGGKPVVVETRETTIPETRVAELVIVLSSTCANVTCSSPGQTCQASTGTCGSSEVSSATLPPYNPGDVDHVDAGSLDATIAMDASGDSGPHPKDAGAKDAHDASDAGVVVHRDAGPCPTYYVSADGGLDSYDGCSPSMPVKTIATAVQLAAAVTGFVPTVEVCAGKYVENALTIGSPMTLKGGYDCGTWTRPPDLGFASFTGMASLTTIENEPSWTQGSTLVLTTGGIVVNGFTIHAATSHAGSIVTSATAASVSCVGQGAAPTLSSDVMVPAAPGMWPPLASVTSGGVYVIQQATATITNSSIAGGIGTAGTSSYGVYVDDVSTASLSGDIIAGGAGPSTSFGLYMKNGSFPDAGAAGAAATIEGCSIMGGTGDVSYGVWANGRRTLTVASNEVELTPQASDGGPASCGVGVFLESAVSAVVTGNRISAGTCDHTGANAVGLTLNTVASAQIYNNMISGGIMTHASSASEAIALNLNTVTNPDIRFNTLVGGVSVDGTASSGISAALLFTSVTGATVADNILAGEAAGDSGIAVSVNCAGVATPLVAFENNVLFNGPAALLRYACPAPYKEYTTMKDTLAAIGMVGPTTGNLTLAASCDLDAGPCAMNTQCGNPESCLAQMFSGWSKAKYGLPSLSNFVDAGCDAQAGNGWTLAATAPCQVVQGGAVDAGVTADIYGSSCRSTATTSMGAAQGGACAP